MTSLQLLMAAVGGVIATHELYAHGIGRGRIAALVQAGALIRIRQGWYGLPELAPLAVSAVRVGGSLGCVSAAQGFGCWMPPGASVHVAVRNHRSRLRRPADARSRLRSDDRVVVHWCDLEPAGRLSLGLEDALRQVVRCQPIEYVVAVVDSALSGQGRGAALLSRKRWVVIAEEFPELTQHLLEVDPESGSGTESVFRIRLLVRCGLRPRTQVSVPGVGRVDFVLGHRLVIEVDSERFHADPVQYRADRRRDALLSARGFRVLRFTYEQVLFDWPQVEASVLAAVARGDHH